MIDTATNTVVATVPVGDSGVAITPNGKHVYVVTVFSNGLTNSVSVIDTATNMVVGTPIPVGDDPFEIAVTPDGKHAYVTNARSNNVSVIDTASNTVVATVPVDFPVEVAVNPDGKHAYVTTSLSGVAVIDTATNTVVATVPGGGCCGVAVAPDGKHVYVANIGSSNSVSVIDTASNMVVATVVGVGPPPHPPHSGPIAIAFTPDGKHAYVANYDSRGTVSVIDTATNMVVMGTGFPIPVGTNPFRVGIIPPPAGVQFLAFSAKLEIDLDRAPKEDRFELKSSFTLSSTASNGINPVTEGVTLQVGTFTATIPLGSFKKHEDEDEDAFFSFNGVIDGVRLKALIKRTGTLRYAFQAKAKGADLTGTKNPVPVMLTIGDDSGTTSVKAKISR